MECGELRQQLESLALEPQDALPADFAEHLHACPDCARELADTQEAWLLLTQDLPAASPREELEHRLMQGIARVNRRPAPASAQANLWRYAVAAAVLCMMTAVVLWQLGQRSREGEPAAREIARLRSLAASMEQLDQLERAFANHDVQFVALARAPSAPIGFLVYDPESAEAHLYAARLKPQRDDAFWVWLLNGEQQVLAQGRLRLHDAAQGLGSALLSLPAGAAVETALITVESAEQPASPSDVEVLRSAVATH